MTEIYLYYLQNEESTLQNILFSDTELNPENYNNLTSGKFYKKCSNDEEILLSYTLAYELSASKEVRFLNPRNIFLNKNKKEMIKQVIIMNPKINIYKQNEAEQSMNLLYNSYSVQGTTSAFGQTNETSLLILFLILNIKDFNVFNETYKNKDKVRFQIPDILFTQHFFTNLVFKSDVVSQYNSDYNRTKNKEYCAQEEKQILKYSLQGESTCFFFIMFFIEQTLELLKEQQVGEKRNIKESFRENENLKIVEKVLNFLVSKDQEFFFCTTKDKIKYFSGNYYYFSKGDPSRENFDEYLYCIKKIKSNEECVSIFNESVPINKIIDRKNIMKYCLESGCKAFAFDETINSFSEKKDIKKEIEEMQNISKSHQSGSGDSEELVPDIEEEFDRFDEFLKLQPAANLTF